VKPILVESQRIGSMTRHYLSNRIPSRGLINAKLLDKLGLAKTLVAGEISQSERGSGGL
jgi:hypothetical protein